MPTINKKMKRTNSPVRSVSQKDRAKIYNHPRWRRLRDVKLMNDPLCERCAEDGRVTIAEDVHHKTSFMSVVDPIKRERLAFDYDNLQSLCKKCHQLIHNGKSYQEF